MSENNYFSGVRSPIELCYPNQTPTDTELTRYTMGELRSLAKRFSEAYRERISNACAEERRSILAGPLPHGIEINRSTGSTAETLIARLVDEKWWRKKLTSVADALREHQAQLAGELGGKSPTQVCCSDRTVNAFRVRKEITDRALQAQFKIKKSSDGTAKVFSLHDISEAAKKNRLNEIFLDIKALECMAQSKGYGCAFITLTAPPEFHSNPKRGKNTYSGANARAANDALQKDWRAVLDSLDNLGISRKDGYYFGFRIVELHEDGCPHWHILFFFDKAYGIIEAVENSIRSRYSQRGSYFENQKDSIVKIIEKNGEGTAMPSSYIFKYLAFALSCDESSDDSGSLALRYKCAIRAMGARQYSFFGVKCSVSKQRALKSIARADLAPRNIKALADALHPAKDIEDRNAEQLKARVRFFEGQADKLNFIKEQKKNRYGEEVSTIHSIKHDDDDESVQISGQCVNITADEAKSIDKGEELASDVYNRAAAREERLVTIITNYSSKSKEQKQELSPAKFRPLSQSQPPQQGLYSALQAINASAPSLPQRATMKDALKSLEQRRGVYYKLTSPPTEMEAEQDDEEFERIGLMILERRRKTSTHDYKDTTLHNTAINC